jgi:hypothetical protein
LASLPILKKIVGKDLNALEYIDGHTYSVVIRNLHPPIFD